jgi:tetratricopeptide (TPR) repeat protein
MAVQTNPIQQRMEYLADQWNDLPKRAYKIIRTLIKRTDYDMLDAFYWYMLGIDSPINDISIIFETEFMGYDYFGTNLVGELEGTVQLWNRTEFSGGVNKVAVEWKPDYGLSEKDEVGVFVDNINALAASLNLPKGRLLIANLLTPHNDRGKELRKWVSALAGKEISPRVKILLTDYTDTAIFEDTAYRHSDEIYTWLPEIDSENAISQVAAMGDPLAPDTEYRFRLINMMNAIGKKEHKKAISEGEKCIEIATANIDKDPYWISQVVVINIALCNEEYMNKKEDKAFDRADKAISMGCLAPEAMGKQTGCSVYAQALVNKGSLYCYKRKWKEATPLFELSAGNYDRSNMNIASLELYRMAGYCAAKNGNSDVALENLVKGFRVSERIDDKELRSGTFSLLIVQLLKESYKEYITEEELDKKAQAVFGEDWRDEIKKTWKDTDPAKLYEDNPYLLEQQKDKK